MQLVPWSVAVACAILAGIAVWQAVSKGEAPTQPVTRYTIAPPPGTRFDSRAPAFALSTGNALIAFSACDADACRLYVRPSDRLDATSLDGTDDAAAPFFSPDARWIAFFADGHLKKVAVKGGAPVTLADAADPLGGTWTSNGQIVYAGAGPGLRRIPDGGGEPVTLTTPDVAHGEVRHVRPSWIPRSRTLLFVTTSSLERASPGRIAALDSSAASRPPVTLLGNAFAATALSKEIIAFATGSELQVAAVDLTRGRISGAPQAAFPKLSNLNGAAQFAVSADGRSIFQAADRASVPTFLWSTRSGGTTDGGTPGEAVPLDDIHGAVLSPDGRRVAGVMRGSASTSDLWIGDLLTGTVTRMTHGEIAAAPVWNRDGTAVWYASSSGGPFAMYQREVDSLQPARKVHAGQQHAFPTSLSADGAMLAFVATDAATGSDIWLLPVAGGGPTPLIRTAFEETAAVFSPDGRLLAYQSNDAGRWEIHVHRLSDHRRLSVSTNGGTAPFWSHDGQVLFFTSGDRLMRAAIAADGRTLGSPAVWLRSGDARAVGIDPKGRVLFERPSMTPSTEAVLTLQWDREVRQLLGPPSPALPR